MSKHPAIFLSFLFSLFACRTSGHTQGHDAGPLSSAERAVPASPNAPALLDAMDARTPVPLLPRMAHHQKQNMRDHLRVVQEVTSALAQGDFDGVRVAAGRIGFSETMGRMCEHMGAGAPGFTELALRFHHTADGIADAAKRQSSEGVLRALGETLALCTSCHQSYKQSIVDEATWATLTGAATPSNAEHGRHGGRE